MVIVTDIVVDTTPISTKGESKGKAAQALDYRGRTIKRIIWEVTDELVYLCTQRCYEQLCSGDMSIRPVGFPRNDVHLV